MVKRKVSAQESPKVMASQISDHAGTLQARFERQVAHCKLFHSARMFCPCPCVSRPGPVWPDAVPPSTPPQSRPSL